MSTVEEQDIDSAPLEEQAIAELDTEARPAAMRAVGTDDDESGESDCPPCKSGAPGWMATFADMATLLMAFFVLILSFSDTELPKFEQINGSIQAAFGIRKIVPTIQIPAARSLVVETFTPAVAQRTVVDQQTQFGENLNAENLVVRDNEASEDFEIEQELRRVEFALADAIESGEIEVRVDEDALVVQIAANNTESPGGSADDSGRAGQVSQRLIELSAAVAEAQLQVNRELRVIAATTSQESSDSDDVAIAPQNSSAQLMERLQQVRSDLSSELQQGLVDVEMVNNMIVIRLASQSSFVSGSADLRPDFMPLLSQVGASIADISGVIRVEGHTDNVPVVFSDRFNSNWDLSAVRAASVAAYLSSTVEIPAQRISVKGLADTVPLESNTSSDGRARNRRIEIIVDGN